MDIDANIVIDRLTQRIASLAKEVAMLEAALESNDEEPGSTPPEPTA